MESKQKQTILIVDDTDLNRAMLANILNDRFNTLEAANGVEAVEILERMHDSISLVLLDIVMDKMDGFEVLAIMNKKKWLINTPVIVISAETGGSYIQHAYELGATDYISRPFDFGIVLRRVENTIMLYSRQRILQDMVSEQIFDKERNSRLMVEILSNIVEFRNGESGLHVHHVKVITEYILKELRKENLYTLSDEEINLISMASALHDIGKVAIDEKILNKPGRLTDEEFAIMKTHSAVGGDMIAKLVDRQDEPLVKIAYEICRWHHERYDGRGYPDGLKGDEIPLSAQVVSIADVYDALTSERVYKKAFPHEEAIRMMVAGECGNFNEKILNCFKNVADDIKHALEMKSENANMTLVQAEIIMNDMLTKRIEAAENAMKGNKHD